MLNKKLVMFVSLLLVVALSGCTFLPHIPDILGVPEGGTITLYVQVTAVYKIDFADMNPPLYAAYFSGYAGSYLEIWLKDENGDTLGGSGSTVFGCMVWPGDHPSVFVGKRMLILKAKVFHNAPFGPGPGELVTFPSSVVVFEGAELPEEEVTPITTT